MPWLICITLAGGCLEQFVPDVGPLQQACLDEDSDLSRDVSYRTDLMAGVFLRSAPGCFACHTPGGETPIGITVGGLDLSSLDSLRRGGARGGEAIVVPGEPCASVLVQKVSDGPPFGARMPLEGMSLSLADRQVIADWIAEGARDN